MRVDVRDNGVRPASVHPVSILNILLGIWLFVSPWVFGAYGNPNAWNAWIVGFFIVLFAAIRQANPGTRFLSWLNMALGVWTFASPWIYGYTANTGRFINSLCVGVLVFLFALTSYSAQPRTVIQQH